VHSVNFSSTGDRVAWVGHESSISVADASKGMSVSVIRTDFLPFLSCLWVSENRLIAAVLCTFGHTNEFLENIYMIYFATRGMVAAPCFLKWKKRARYSLLEN
jgi:hypothetical protein